MTHPIDLLSAYLDGELVPTDQAEVANHLHGCASCAGDLEGISRVRDWIRGMPVEEAPIPLLPALRPSRWTWAAASIAAAALAVGLVVTPAQTEVLDLDTLAGQHTARVVVSPGISSIRGPVVGR